jgi:hypothetical protein
MASGAVWEHERVGLTSAVFEKVHDMYEIHGTKYLDAARPRRHSFQVRVPERYVWSKAVESGGGEILGPSDLTLDRVDKHWLLCMQRDA